MNQKEKDTEMTSTSASSSPWTESAASGFWASTSASHSPRGRHVGENVLRLVAWREISPRVKRPLKRLWGETAKLSVSCLRPRYELIDSKQGLIAWLEAESLRHCSAKYCALVPPPRSTIAAAFSPDGCWLASTHGDHTVKIICCQTGACLKVLSGHRRTPWVVGFHPFRQEILASGSLDHQVRLWDANTAECIGSRDFNRPIASIAFHAQGDLLAVASGHKLYIWRYSAKEDESTPVIILRTRRSLRAVHFHPHAAPILLTAEVNDLDSPDSPMTVATSHGYLRNPPPDVVFTPVSIPRGSGIPISSQNLAPLMPFPRFIRPDSTVVPSNMTASQTDVLPVNPNAKDSEAENTETLLSVRELDLQTRSIPIEAAVDGIDLLPESGNPGIFSENMGRGQQSEPENSVYESGVDMLLRAAERHMMECQNDSLDIAEVKDVQLSNQTETSSRPELGREHLGESSISRSRPVHEGQTIRAGPVLWPFNIPQNVNVQVVLRDRQLNQFLPLGDRPGWEYSFLQGWVMGQTQAGLNPILPTSGNSHMQTMPSDVPISDTDQPLQNPTVSLASAAMAAGMATDRTHGRPGGRHRARLRVNSQAGAAMGLHVGTEGGQQILGSAEATASHEAFAATAATAAAELPCTVKLRIWPYDIKNPCALLDPKTCRLTIPHAVLCSEMGAHFSPCGRFLAACVACVLPSQESEAGLQSQSNLGAGGTAVSPTRHPISAQQVVYELRIYSLEEATFGEVLASRAIRAAHCLTSIQFSPTSAHILLSYGRRHNSLLRSILVDGTETVPSYTILEIYRVSDMKLVRVLPSAEDEVNVACFHPLAGGGLVYGTKEGKLRLLNNSSLHAKTGTGFQENVFEAGCL